MAFTIAPMMFNVGVAVMPRTVKVVPENQKYVCVKAWNAAAPLANLAISFRRCKARLLLLSRRSAEFQVRSHAGCRDDAFRSGAEQAERVGHDQE